MHRQPSNLFQRFLKSPRSGQGTRAHRDAPVDVVLLRLASWRGRARHHPENVMAPLELGYAWSLLARSGLKTRLIDTELGGPDDLEMLDQLVRSRPRLIVIHGITPSVPLMLELAARLRESLPETFLLATGQHATAEPLSLLGHQGFHACALQEPEETIAELACALPGSSPRDVPGLVFPGPNLPERSPERALRQDLDALPFPHHPLFMDPRYRVAHPLIRVRRVRWGFLLASRGCPFHCIYCTATLRNSYGALHRTRSTTSIVAEIDWLTSLGVTALHFKDDIFTLNREHSLELCEALSRRQRPLPFTMQTRVDCVDLELLRSLRRAGCASVLFGVESGDQEIVDRLQKGTTIEQTRAAFRWAREAGLARIGCFLLGNPGETLEQMRHTLSLAHELDPELIQVAFLTPYPGSALYQAIPPENRLPFDRISHYNGAGALGEHGAASLREMQRRFYGEIVLNPRFLTRYAWIRRREILWNLDRELLFFWEVARYLHDRGA